jgi:PAS domain S-box-containing protein
LLFAVFFAGAMFRLLRYFSITSLVSVVVTSIALSYFYRQVSVRDLVAIGENSNVDKTIMFSNLLGSQVRSFRELSSPLGAGEIRAHPATRELDTEVKRMMFGQEVVKVKIYDLSGKTIYSSDAQQIGEDKSANAGFARARSGLPVSELTHRDSFSAFENVIENRDLLSSYVPLREQATGTIWGVFEVYEDVTPLLARIEATQRTVALGVSGVLLILYAILLLIVLRADAVLRRQDIEIQRSAGALRQMNEELESRVQERTAALAQSAESLHKLSQAVEQSPDSIVITDTAGTIEYVNPAYCEITGYSATEAIGSNPRILKSGETPSSVYAELWSSVRAGRVWRGELCNRKKNGNLFWEQVSIAPICAAGGSISHLVEVKQDITAQKEAERRILDLNESLERRVAERTSDLKAAVEQLESFSYSVSHDLRAPLRAIAGFSAILREETGEQLSPDHRALLERIGAKVHSMNRLIDDLLEFSRASHVPLAPSEFPLDDLAREVGSALEDAYPRSMLAVRRLPCVTADRSLLRQVLVNLISNAYKYSARQEQPRIEIGQVDNSGEIAFYVRDNGAGFDPARTHQLFEVFQRLHLSEDFEGTGVGLAIVRRIIERHRGRVWAESVLGEGAIFYFTLG